MDLFVHEKLRENVLHTLKRQPNLRYKEIQRLKSEDWAELRSIMERRLHTARVWLWPGVVIGAAICLLRIYKDLEAYYRDGDVISGSFGLGFMVLMVAFAAAWVYQRMRLIADLTHSIFCIDLIEAEQDDHALN